MDKIRIFVYKLLFYNGHAKYEVQNSERGIQRLGR